MQLATILYDTVLKQDLMVSLIFGFHQMKSVKTTHLARSFAQTRQECEQVLYRYVEDIPTVCHKSLTIAYYMYIYLYHSLKG